jgi:DNA-binding transcriptional regulator YhcF (GntR family)
MLPFTITLRPGVPIYEQVVYAVTRAIVTDQLRPGDAFPSVRTLSQELKINPNTAHKIIATLVEDRLLVVRPGIGTLVSGTRESGGTLRRALLDDGAERLVVEARRDGFTLTDVLAAIRRHWARTVRRAG